jgi:hypothetical protein
MGRLALVWLIACLSAGGWLIDSSLDPTPAVAQDAFSEPSQPQYVLKNIEDVKAGERVWAYDTVARKWFAKPVSRWSPRGIIRTGWCRGMI